jgi:MoaA/NifB/PqqE/SkfB family radical SAM enzyme
MNTIILEPTNRCNRSCRHCLRNKADPPGSLPLDTAERIFSQAEPLGFEVVCLTGGEVALYPHLGELLRLIVGHGFKFSLVTNGCRFREYLLPVLLEPGVKERITYVGFSLDGATAKTHDGLRGPKSFREVIEGMALCRENRLPVSLKSVVTKLNRGELTELALLGARLGAQSHAFLFPLPTPALLREGIMPSPEEAIDIMHWIMSDLAGVVTTSVKVEGYSTERVCLDCGHLVGNLNVDYQGHLILCCTLSHVTLGDGIPTPPGGEVIADLKHVSLKEGIIRKYQKAAEIMEHRLNDGGRPEAVSAMPCYWCLKHFGKLGWLEDFPGSPWKAWLLDGKEAKPS